MEGRKISQTDEMEVDKEELDVHSLFDTSDPEMCEPPPTNFLDQNMIVNEARHEATFRFYVPNISTTENASLFSQACYVRNLPWKIMVMPKTLFNDRNVPIERALGLFLQCNGESEFSNWSCHAVAELRLLSWKQGQPPVSRKIKHVFCAKENDWGFSLFMPWSDIVDPEKEYIMNDTLRFEVSVKAEPPHGVFWDSKKYTGYVGLKNQGATCYMNSLLQTLYFTNKLRKAVYKMPTEYDDSSKSVALALQRVFHDLQFNDKPVGTRKLTRSFGWETMDSFMQHDVQEFLRVLLDKLESKMKSTCIEGTIPKLFEGRTSSYVECKNVEYTSKRTETYYDIQLNIKGKKNIYESFKDYIERDTLDGDNKYDAGDHGLQDAEKGVIFVTFPPVLHLHLMRFQYDPETDSSVKFNDRFEFYEKINLDQYLEKQEDTPADYILHAVLVHAGDNHGGHYVVFINPTGNGQWCKFDDDVVAVCSKNEAIEQNYGGFEDEFNLNVRHCSSAYMLVYIRNSEIKSVLEPVKDSDIPNELNDKFFDEISMEGFNNKMVKEAASYMTVNILLEECLECHSTTDLFDVLRAKFISFRVKKTSTVLELQILLVESFKYPVSKMRIWHLDTNIEGRPRFHALEDNLDKQVMTYTDPLEPWVIFLEVLPADSPLETLQPFDKIQHILLFFKLFDPIMNSFMYCGYGYYQFNTKISELTTEMNSRAGYKNGTSLIVYEERRGCDVIKLEMDANLRSLSEGLGGAILIFEKAPPSERISHLPTCTDYVRYLQNRVNVIFIDKDYPNDQFIVELSQYTTYKQVLLAVAQKIDGDPSKIRLFSCRSSNYKDLPGISLNPHVDGTLRSMMGDKFKTKEANKLIYQSLSKKMEMDNKRPFKCLWLTSNLKEEKELVLYPDKEGTIKSLIDEAVNKVEFSGDGTKKLRICEVQGHRISLGPDEDTKLDTLNGDTNISKPMKMFRLEEVPVEELTVTPEEMLVPVCHFNKDVYTLFGIPFFIKIQQGETYGSVKKRMQKKLSVSDKEWEKYNLAYILANKVEYIKNDDDQLNLDDFRPTQPNLCAFLGLDHVNKFQRKSRPNHFEKAIKIYN